VIANTFSDQVRVICAALNLNKEELVHVLGVGLTTVKRWQKGKTRAYPV
jgi:DNA-binding transcriptional regulator YiaG